jgi:hypothetical protein
MRATLYKPSRILVGLSILAFVANYIALNWGLTLSLLIYVGFVYFPGLVAVFFSATSTTSATKFWKWALGLTLLGLLLVDGYIWTISALNPPEPNFIPSSPGQTAPSAVDQLGLTVDFWIVTVYGTLATIVEFIALIVAEHRAKTTTN